MNERITDRVSAGLVKTLVLSSNAVLKSLTWSYGIRLATQLETKIYFLADIDKRNISNKCNTWTMVGNMHHGQVRRHSCYRHH